MRQAQPYPDFTCATHRTVPLQLHSVSSAASDPLLRILAAVISFAFAFGVTTALHAYRWFV